MLGYYSTNTDPTKRVRAIEVQVNRPSITVASRRAYSLKTPGTPVPHAKRLRASPQTAEHVALRLRLAAADQTRRR